MGRSTALANPTEMIRQGAPHLIHSDEELAKYTEALFKLTAKSRGLAQTPAFGGLRSPGRSKWRTDAPVAVASSYDSRAIPGNPSKPKSKLKIRLIPHTWGCSNQPVNFRPQIVMLDVSRNFCQA
jgi:hypothetical protein